MPLITPRPQILKHFNTNPYDGVGAVALYGSPTISSVKQRFIGENSLYVTTGNTVTFVNDDNFNFGTDDFSIAWSEYLTAATASGASLIVSNGNTTSGYSGIMFGYNSGAARYLYMSSNGSSWDIANALSLGTIASCLNTWVDWELSRHGNTFYVFKNGVLVLTFTSALAIYYNKDWYTWYGIYLNVAWLGIAYMCEFIVIKGTCLHTTTFTPNTEVYTILPGNFTGVDFNNINAGNRRHTNNGYLGNISFMYGDRKIIPRVGIDLIQNSAGGRSEISKLGISSLKVINLNKQAVTKNCLISRHKSVTKMALINRVAKISQGVNGVLINRRYSGLKQNAIILDKRKVSEPVVVIKMDSFGDRSKGINGFDAKTFQVDSNAGDNFDVLVTPTHQYKNQLITVSSSTSNGKLGKWQFKVNNVITISLSEEVVLDTITFLVDKATLVDGDNTCKLEYMYSDGTSEFITLKITKEKFKRSSVERTFKSYDGGYVITGDKVFRNALFGGKYVSGLYTYTNCTVTSTDETSIDLGNYRNIMKFDFVGDGCLFLLSFDKRNTWYAYNGTVWNRVSPEDIVALGMTADIIKNLDYVKISSIFSSTQLDFKIYMDATKSAMTNVSNDFVITPVSVAGNSGDHWGGINTTSYSIPAGYNVSSMSWTQIFNNLDSGAAGQCIIYVTTNNTAETAIVSNAIVKGTLTGNYSPPSGQRITRIRLTAQTLTMWGGCSQSAILEMHPSIAGISQFITTLSDNLPPIITDVSVSNSTVHKENSILSASIIDLESDAVQYHITVNGSTEVVPWTDFIPTPVSLAVPIPYTDDIVGTNTVTIQAFDGEKYAKYDTYITQTNSTPHITGILTMLYLTATAGDAENDTIKYRILLNGAVKSDWTDFNISPVSIKYKINRKDVKIGQQNSLVVEVEDDLGGTASCTFDFVGVDTKKRSAFIM